MHVDSVEQEGLYLSGRSLNRGSACGLFRAVGFVPNRKVTDARSLMQTVLREEELDLTGRSLKRRKAFGLCCARVFHFYRKVSEEFKFWWTVFREVHQPAPISVFYELGWSW